MFVLKSLYEIANYILANRCFSIVHKLLQKYEKYDYLKHFIEDKTCWLTYDNKPIMGMSRTRKES
jgi:hypothetical protein